VRLDVLAALTLYCFVGSITPGPNNLMLLASGVKFGVRRSLPHLFGVVFGFAFMVAVVGLGLDALFVRYPLLLPAMRYLGAAYMVWLAIKIALAPPPEAAGGGGKPLSFIAAVMFQWVNPKGWIIALGALTTYSVFADYTRSVIVVTAIYAIVCAPCCAFWVASGSSLSAALASPRVSRAFNLTMAALLVGSIAVALAEE